MKFLVDAMCGKLSRFLRIFGYDTVYANDLEKYFNLNPVPDKKLLEYAIKEERMIITRDYPFYKIAKEKAIYLEGEGIYNYLNQLKLKLNLNYNFNNNTTRCSICNSELLRVEDKNTLKTEVLQDTYNSFNEFYRCSNFECKKIFWKGTHIDNIINKLKKKVN